MAERAETRATGRQGEPASPVGWIAHERDGLAGLIGTIHPGDHDPVRAEVERPPDPQSLAGLGSHESGGDRGAQCVKVGQQVGLGPGAVLEIDDHPVEPGAADELGRHRRAEPGEGPEQGLTGLQSRVKVDDARDGYRRRCLGHARMMPARAAARSVRAHRSGFGSAVYGPLTSPVVSTTSRLRPVMTSSSCMTSSSIRGSLIPVMYHGEPLSARIIP